MLCTMLQPRPRSARIKRGFRATFFRIKTSFIDAHAQPITQNINDLWTDRTDGICESRGLVARKTTLIFSHECALRTLFDARLQSNLDSVGKIDYFRRRLHRPYLFWIHVMRFSDGDAGRDVRPPAKFGSLRHI